MASSTLKATDHSNDAISGNVNVGVVSTTYQSILAVLEPNVGADALYSKVPLPKVVGVPVIFLVELFMDNPVGPPLIPYVIVLCGNPL